MNIKTQMGTGNSLDPQYRAAILRRYKQIDRELWELEGYDKIGAKFDENKMKQLETEAIGIEVALCLPPRQRNLV
jgi:hypothetical protein